KLDEHRIKDVELEDVDPGETIDLGPFELELVHMTHSIPDSCAVALHNVDGKPADVSRLAELGREGILVLCGDSTNADRLGFSPSESSAGPHLERVIA